MMYIKPYKIFEDFGSTKYIKDILLPLVDKGFDVKVWYEKNQRLTIATISKYLSNIQYYNGNNNEIDINQAMDEIKMSIHYMISNCKKINIYFDYTDLFDNGCDYCEYKNDDDLLNIIEIIEASNSKIRNIRIIFENK